MKKIVKVFSLLIAPLIFVGAFLSGCKKGKSVDVENGEIMQDIDVAPKLTAAYEQYSKKAIEDYKAVAENYTNADGEIDLENPPEEVIAAASEAAAKLFAYACYNERTLDQYVWFNNQTAGTVLGEGNYANIQKQDYYLRVNKNDEHCGYRFNYTYKWAKEYEGLVGSFKDMFEAARMGIVTDTDTLYRFDGDTASFRYAEKPNKSLNCEMIETDWQTKGDAWGVRDREMVKDEFIPPDKIEDDIIARAETCDDLVIHGNINILAKDIVKYASIIEDTEAGRYLVMMNIDTEVANKDEASLKMLRSANSPCNDCKWKSGDNEPDAKYLEEDTGLKIIFSIWENGLFSHYSISERWGGHIIIFNGTAESAITVNYSYSDRDCDMTKNLEMLEAAKKALLNGE